MIGDEPPRHSGGLEHPDRLRPSGELRPFNELSDRELMARHVGGDADAFGEIFRRHRDRLWAVALRTLGNSDDAADALQDAMISAFRRAESYRGEAAVTTWLHRIVVNACLDRVRREAVRATEPMPEGDRSEQVASPRDEIGQRETSMDVTAALATLPVEQRAALVLVDMAGYSVDDAARLLQVAPGTVKSRCARGRAKLLPLLRAGGPNSGSTASASSGADRPDASSPDAARGTAEPPPASNHRSVMEAGTLTKAVTCAPGPQHPTWRAAARQQTEHGRITAAGRWTRVSGEPEERTALSAAHLSVDDLADLHADLLPAASRSDAQAHLDLCTRCRATAADLEGVSDVLAAAAAVSMPPHVTARLESALAAAGRERAATVGSGASVSSLSAARARRSVTPALRRAAIAAVGVAAVIGGGFLFGDLILSGASDDSPTAAAYGSADSGGDTAEESAATDGSVSPPAPAVDNGEMPVETSGGVYTAASLVSDVQRLIARGPERSTPDSNEPAPTTARAPDPFAGGVPGVSYCIDGVGARADNNATPLAVDVGSYDGAPAVVVVLPSSSGDAGEIWVVSAGCLDGTTALEVLTERALPTLRDGG